MPARTGEEFLAGLSGDREVWLGDRRVADVASDPDLSGAAHALAEVYDLQHKEADSCLMPDPETGEPINVSHMIPGSKDDLMRRHAGLEKVAEFSVGLMGRTPDYMNVTYAGFAGRAEEWAINGNEEGAENLVNYQKYLRRNDISLTHALLHPTVDKGQGDAPRPDNPVALRKVGETEHGIIVRGSRILSTLAPFADELAVYPGIPLQEGTEAFALSFCIPMSTPGLKFICRDSVSARSNRFDHPISSRFDEQDAFIIFDDVEVPRDRIHIDGNVAVYNSVMAVSWWPNIMQQTSIRALTKLEFAWGIATRMAAAINDDKPQTQQMLGEIWSYAEILRCCLRAAEEEAFDYGNGVWLLNHTPMTALRASVPAWMARTNEIIRLLGSHNVFALATRTQLDDPDLRPLIDAYLTGAGDVDAEMRSRIFRLAWDFTGTGLAGRNEQYERFYLGSAPRNYQMAQLMANPGRAQRLVDRFLNEPLD